MNKTEIEQVQYVLRAVDRTSNDLDEYETPGGLTLQEAVDAAISICEASLARVVEPVAHVGDTRFEGWLSEHQFSDTNGSKLPMYHKQDMRDAYWAGFSESVRKVSEEQVFEEWLARVCPSGDVESVQAQWLASWDYREWCEDAAETAPQAAAQPIQAVVVEEIDPLYQQAVQIVREHNRASISLVQRNLRISYNRAAKLIESMAKEGLVTSNNNGSYNLAAINAKGANHA